MPHEFLDRYSRRDSPIHRLGALAKLVASLVLIGGAVATPIRYWPVHAGLAGGLLVVYALARLPWGYLLSRLLGFLPLILLLSLAAPLTRALREGWDVMASVLVCGLLAFTTMLVLVNTTPFGALLGALRRLRVPIVFVATLAFMYRYVFVLLDELARMRRARAARRFRARHWGDWKTSAQMIGVLLVRSFERAERVYGAMCARGWDGQVRTLED